MTSYILNAPGFVMEATFYEGKMKLELVIAVDTPNMVVNNTQRGFVTVTKVLTKMNDKQMREIDHNQLASSAIPLDFNSMCAEILSAPLVAGEIYELQPEEI